MDNLIYDIIIIGCGPAGMTAAIYAKRLNLSVLVLESNAPGGMMINTETISNYPGYENINGVDLSMAMYNQMIKLGAIQKSVNVNKIEKENEIFVVGNEIKSFYGKSIIIATGTKNKTLGIANERKYFYRGISWCAICDGPLYKGRDVAVIGGGNTALSSALTLAKFAKTVYIIHRRDEFRGDPILINKVKDIPNIRIIYNANVVDFTGNELSSIALKYNDGRQDILNVSGCFEAIGRLPNSEFIDCEKDNDGFIIVNKEFETSVKGIYACGDVIDKSVRQIATAVSDGAICAINACNYIK